MKKRFLIKNEIIHIRYVLLNTILCIAFMIYPLKTFSNISWYISFPLIFIMFFTMWEFFSYILLNLEITFSKEIKNYKRNQEKLNNYPTIAFILPSYQEPFEVAKMTFDSAYNLKYKGKKEIIVVDNSKNTATLDFINWKNYVNSYNSKSDNIKVKFIYNRNQDGLKPGNLDLAQKHIKDAEFVIFLDIDSTFPYNEKILENSLIEFKKDKSLGWVQFLTKSTNHHFNNCSQAIGIYQNLLRITCFFRSLGGFTLFYGHNAIWKKNCLLKLGPWLEKHKGQIMVTEDILKTIIAYNKGYYGKSIPIETGEWIPNSLNALASMWQRWTYGTCQIIGKYLFKIIKTKKMTFFEKYDLLHSIMLYWGYAVTYPLAIIYQFLLPPTTSFVFILISCILPQVFSGIAVYKHHIRYQPYSFTKKIINFYASSFIISGYITIVQLKGTFNYLFNIPQGWKVTAKGVENDEKWLSVLKKHRLFLVSAILLLISAIVSWQIHYDNDLSQLINYFPMLFISTNLLLCIVIYGKSGRIKENSIHNSTIDAINLRKNSVGELFNKRIKTIDEVKIED